MSSIRIVRARLWSADEVESSFLCYVYASFRWRNPVAFVICFTIKSGRLYIVMVGKSWWPDRISLLFYTYSTVAGISTNDEATYVLRELVENQNNHCPRISSMFLWVRVVKFYGCSLAKIYRSIFFCFLFRHKINAFSTYYFMFWDWREWKWYYWWSLTFVNSLKIKLLRFFHWAYRKEPYRIRGKVRIILSNEFYF